MDQRKENQRRKFFQNRRGWYRYKNRSFGAGSWSKHEKQDHKIAERANEKCEEEDVLEGVNSCPYPGWKLYFPDEVFDIDCDIAHKVRYVGNFIKKKNKLFNLSTIEENRCFQFDLKLLNEDEEFKKFWPEFESDISCCPDRTIKCIGLAMHTIVSENMQKEMKEDKPDMLFKSEMINIPIIWARIVNYDMLIQLKQLKANYYGKLISIRGTVIRVGNIKLISTVIAFECKSCSSVQCKKQNDGIFSLPEQCKRKGCRSQSFSPMLSSPLTCTINWQCVRVQEISVDDQREGGRVPRTIDCELTADLVGSCSPGDIVILNGIVKSRSSEEVARHKTSSVFQLYLDIVSVINSKLLIGSGKSTVEFNLKDYYAIKEIHSENQLFRLIVHSLCPSIYGHEVVKAGLLLCMFGGCPKYHDSRAEPHILIVGDPGLGKSRLLQACAHVAPRGVYVCGNTSTSSGLTVTLNRESGGDYALEAGALVLSDQGCCCIDEFDKMTSQHQALLEAMEQQSVSIAKAGVVCSLPARTSILAAANPIGGHYNKAKTVSENLKLGPALLSRFDLVFILLDQPNEEMDSLLSEHVMALHSGLKTPSHAVFETSSASSSGTRNESSIHHKLKVQRFEELDLIPHCLLRKYIAYARKYVKPRLTSEAARVLQEFYLGLRKFYQGVDCTPVTTRQLESLIRLTEARARLELRVEASVTDATEVVEIFKYSMWDTFSDELGMIDFTRSQHGSGMSSKNLAKKFLRVLQRKAETQSRSVFSVKELKEVATAAEIHVSDFYSFLSTLNIQGFILKKGDQLYQVLSAE